MKAIYIKYLPATGYKSLRIKADTRDGNSITMARSTEDINDKQDAERVAYALMDKMGWKGELIGNGDVFVFASEGVSKRVEVSA